MPEAQKIILSSSPLPQKRCSTIREMQAAENMHRVSEKKNKMQKKREVEFYHAN